MKLSVLSELTFNVLKHVLHLRFSLAHEIYTYSYLDLYNINITANCCRPPLLSTITSATVHSKAWKIV